MRRGVIFKVRFNEYVDLLKYLATIGDQKEVRGTVIKYWIQVVSWVPKPYVVGEKY